MAEIKLSEKQIQLLKDANTAATEAATIAKQHIDSANSKRKSLEDLILLFCDIHGVLDPSKVNFDLDKGVATLPDQPLQVD